MTRYFTKMVTIGYDLSTLELRRVTSDIALELVIARPRACYRRKSLIESQDLPGEKWIFICTGGSTFMSISLRDRYEKPIFLLTSEIENRSSQMNPILLGQR